MTRIKVCGLSRADDIEAVNLFMPEYIGFVFAKSPRRVTISEAEALKRILNKNIHAVGVFVNESIDKITAICDREIVDMIQIHGDEDEEYIRRLKSKTKKLVIRAFRIKSIEDIKRAQNCCADYVLLDTFKEKTYGGSGHIFPWSLTKTLQREYFLAGGIHGENVTEAVNTCHPYCIDVSSGVETEGQKDINKIKEIIEKIRSVK